MCYFPISQLQRLSNKNRTTINWAYQEFWLVLLSNPRSQVSLVMGSSRGNEFLLSIIECLRQKKTGHKLPDVSKGIWSQRKGIRVWHLYTAPAFSMPTLACSLSSSGAPTITLKSEKSHKNTGYWFITYVLKSFKNESACCSTPY